METITNAASTVASAASRVIYGETDTEQTGKEPVSGEMGDTTKGEPYDAGNADSTNTDLTNPKTNTTKDTSPETNETNAAKDMYTGTETPDKSTYLPIREKANILADMDSTNSTTKSDVPGNTASTAPIQPEREHDKTGAIDTRETFAAFASDKPSSSNEPSAKGPEPSVSADPASGAETASKQQGADRPEDEPNTDEHQRIKEAKKEAEETQNVDVSGPGPVPLEEKAKAGVVPTTAGGDDDGPQKESHGEGTGEKYVKSSGMKAEGGDFDAANPGAGKEADRLLEEKGVHHTTPGETATEDTASGSPSESPSGSKKPSLKEKIKAKLHKH